MAMLDFLGRGTGEYITGTLKQGGVGALGDIASRQVFGLVREMLPEASDPAVEAGAVAGIAMITGGIVERFVPPLAGLGQAWAAVPVAHALTALASRLTDFNLGSVGMLDAYATRGALPHATVGELDHYNRTATPDPADLADGMVTPDPARNLAGAAF